MFKEIFIILQINSLLFLSSRSQDVGTSCTVEQSGAAGICTIINSCPAVLSAISKRRKYTRCTFRGHVEVVCCAIAESGNNTVAESTTPSAPVRISEKKCLEYSRAVYEIVSSPIIDMDGNAEAKVSVYKCGFTSTPLILGGEYARPREFPHMATVGYRGSGNNVAIWACGGSLISDEYVLTAAHCLHNQIFGAVAFVRLGDLNIGTTDDDALVEEFNVSQAIYHPNYRNNSKYHDIGLLKLDRKLNFDSYKRPACLANTFQIKESKSIASGWGDTAHRTNPSDHLLKVTLENFMYDECFSAYASQLGKEKLMEGISNESQICAGSHTELKDTCQGDSGGPLQVYHSLPCMYKIIGITSFGYKCGRGKPGVYTRVFSYLDWIEEIVWKNEK